MNEEFDIPENLLGNYKPLEINEHDYYMGLAMLTSLRSVDPSTRVGACLVRGDDVIALGYNHVPGNWSISDFPWERDDEIDEAFRKYAYIVHAEVDCALKCDAKDTTCYVTLYPCVNCLKHLSAAGVKKVVYLHKMNIKGEMIAAYAAKKCGVEIVSYDSLKTQSLDSIILEPNKNEKERIRTTRI